MPSRAKCLNVLKKHLDMEKQIPKHLPTSTSRDHTVDVNIQAMLHIMDECDMLSILQRDYELRNPFTNTAATPEQQHDLLNFCDMVKLPLKTMSVTAYYTLPVQMHHRGANIQ